MTCPALQAAVPGLGSRVPPQAARAPLASRRRASGRQRPAAQGEHSILDIFGDHYLLAIAATLCWHAGGTAVLESTDEVGWDEKYGDGAMLSYGTSSHQGPRDDMEDFLAVVPKARCGFLYAGTPPGSVVRA